MITAIVFATFIGIVCWAYSPSRKAEFDRRAHLGEDE